MKAAIYARVSTTNGQSPAMQLDELRDYCRRLGNSHRVRGQRPQRRAGKPAGPGSPHGRRPQAVDRLRDRLEV